MCYGTTRAVAFERRSISERMRSMKHSRASSRSAAKPPSTRHRTVGAWVGRQLSCCYALFCALCAGCLLPSVSLDERTDKASPALPISTADGGNANRSAKGVDEVDAATQSPARVDAGFELTSPRMPQGVADGGTTHGNDDAAAPSVSADASTEAVFCPEDPASDPCFPGGACKNSTSGFSCECEPGYDGSGTKSCVNHDDCPPGVCMPFGRCMDGLGTYRCLCTTVNPPPPDRQSCPYQADPDQSLHDATTGLTWSRSRPDALRPDEEASSYCESLADDGTAWRLPTARELTTMPGPQQGCYASTTGRFCFAEETEHTRIVCVRLN